MEENQTIYIFKRHKSIYLVNAENEDFAWKYLQQKISWSMDIVKKSFTLTKFTTFGGIMKISL